MKRLICFLKGGTWVSEYSETARHIVFSKPKSKCSDCSNKKTLYRLLIILLLWVSISAFIQRLKCPSMTETELFLNIPNSFVFDWSYCE